jgi:hypothetical protein
MNEGRPYEVEVVALPAPEGDRIVTVAVTMASACGLGHLTYLSPLLARELAARLLEAATAAEWTPFDPDPGPDRPMW